MPTYEYECEKTGRRFELLQNMSDDPIRQCPECGARARRLIGTGGGIIVKGKGSYAADYRTSSSEGPSCGRSRTCCGRDVPCETRPCDA